MGDRLNQMDMPLVKVAPKPDLDAFLLAMFLMYARAPRNPNPEIDGHFDLGEIGQDREKNWSKFTPYSPAQPKELCSE